MPLYEFILEDLLYRSTRLYASGLGLEAVGRPGEPLPGAHHILPPAMPPTAGQMLDAMMAQQQQQPQPQQHQHQHYSTLGERRYISSGERAPDQVVREVPRAVPTEVEVVREVPKEVVREVIKEVIREVPVEVPVEVIKEVPVEVIRTIIKEVPRETIKEVPVEVRSSAGRRASPSCEGGNLRLRSLPKPLPCASSRPRRKRRQPVSRRRSPVRPSCAGDQGGDRGRAA